MILEEGRNLSVQFVLSKEREGIASFKVFSSQDNAETLDKEWRLHVTGTIHVNDAASFKNGEVFDQAVLQARCEQEIEVRDLFLAMQKIGAELGPCFQGIEKLWHGKNECFARLVLPAKLDDEACDYVVHPALIQAAIQVMSSSLMTEKTCTCVCMPAKVSRYRAYNKSSSVVWCHAIIHESSENDTETIVGDIKFYDESSQLVASIEGIQLERTDLTTFRRFSHEDIDDWLYELVWRPLNNTGMPDDLSTHEVRDWLIFGPSNGFAKDLAMHIKENGGRSLLVSGGDRFEHVEDHFTINYEHKEHYSELVTHLERPLRGVVFSLDCDSIEVTDSHSLRLNDQIKKACGSVLYLVQTIINTVESGIPRLYILTRGAHLITKEDKIRSLAAGALWGLGRVIALEHQELSCVIIDRDPAENQDELRTLFGELCFNDGEDQIAYRNNQRYVVRLVPHVVSRSQRDAEFSLPVNASYLITGGLGSLGLHVAHWMVEKGARHLILMGRSGASPEAGQKIAQLEQSGAEILVIKGDVAIADDVTLALKTISLSMPALRGIVHASGVLDDGMLVQQDWERFGKVLAPKVSGAWNLHLATLGIPLDFFVLMSSTSTIFPNYGQSSYSTANAFLDALAHYRQANRLPAVSINWSAWRGGGMAASVVTRERARWAEQGFSLLKPDDALEALERILDREDDPTGRYARGMAEIFPIPLRYQNTADVLRRSARSNSQRHSPIRNTSETDHTQSGRGGSQG